MKIYKTEYLKVVNVYEVEIQKSKEDENLSAEELWEKYECSENADLIDEKFIPDGEEFTFEN